MFVVNLLHKIELGVWKLVLMHLIQMLYARPNGQSLVANMDARYVYGTILRVT